MGFVSCFMIYDFMILLVWGILALAFSASQRGNAVGIIASDILAALVVAVGYWHTGPSAPPPTRSIWALGKIIESFCSATSISASLSGRSMCAAWSRR